MTIAKRALIMGVLLAAALVFYGAAKMYSPALVLHIVEQALIQKAPSGTDPALVRARLHSLLAGDPDPGARMERLFRISAYLEKVQTLTSQELDGLLAIEKPASDPKQKSYSLRKSGNFFLPYDVI